MYGLMILNYYVLYVVCMLCHVCVVQCIVEFKSSLELDVMLVHASTLNKTYFFLYLFIYLCVCFVDRCLSFCTFSFGHCVLCSSSIYRF